MKSDYKLIVSDFDWTLAGADMMSTPKVTKAVREWQEEGNMFSIATGRQFLMIKKECERLSVKNPVVVRGGAEIVDPITGSILLQHVIDKDVVSELLRELKNGTYKIAIEKDDAIYTDFYFDPRLKDIISYKELEEFVLQDVPKLLVLMPTLAPETETHTMHEISVKFPQLHITQVKLRAGIGWDITPASATKHMGVLELIKILGLEKEQVVGVGDGYNDFPLLEACGLKVAMGNAVDELKEIADIVVPSFENDGIAFLIEKLLSK